MEIIQLSEVGVDAAVSKAVAVLRAGDVVLYPTDTLYGLGADAFSNDAVDKVYAIKGRNERKPVHCVVSDMDMAAKYAEVNDIAKNLADKFLPGPLTLVLKKKLDVDSGIARNIPTIGVRVPYNEFCLALAKSFGPYTTTSANIAGGTNQRSIADILEQLGDRASMIDLVIDVGELPEQKPSTVVDVSTGDAKILREGAVSVAELTRAAL